MKKTIIPVIAGLVLSVALVGCSGGDDTDVKENTAGEGVPTETEEVTVEDLDIPTPTNWEDSADSPVTGTEFEGTKNITIDMAEFPTADREAYIAELVNAGYTDIMDGVMFSKIDDEAKIERVVHIQDLDGGMTMVTLSENSLEGVTVVG